MTVTRLFTNILTDDVAGSRAFYRDLLGLEVHFDSDWFVILKPPGDTLFELGLLQADHAITPAAAKGMAAGAYITLVVDDVRAVYERAQGMRARVIEPPTELFYGQTRLLVADPNGIVLDISAPTPAA